MTQEKPGPMSGELKESSTSPKLRACIYDMARDGSREMRKEVVETVVEMTFPPARAQIYLQRRTDRRRSFRRSGIEVQQGTEQCRR